MPEIGARHGPSHENNGNDEINISGLTGATEIVDTPADGETTKGISSNWAYDHNADVTKHRPVFVDRGDPTTYDFTHTTMGLGTGWHDMNLSTIVPANTIAVALYVIIKNSNVGWTLDFRKNGNSNTYNKSRIESQVGTVYRSSDLIVILDSNRIIEFNYEGGAIEEAYVVVKGWWI